MVCDGAPRIATCGAGLAFVDRDMWGTTVFHEFLHMARGGASRIVTCDTGRRFTRHPPPPVMHLLCHTLVELYPFLYHLTHPGMVGELGAFH